MKLYIRDRAPNPRRVQIFLREKDIDIPVVDLDIGKKEHRTQNYARLNPLQQLPTLVFDDGTSLSESVAICRYFEEMEPEPPLFGVGARGKAEVEMWQRRMEMAFLLPVANVFRHTHPFMAGLEVPQVPEWAEANRPRVASFLKILDDHLRDHRFAAGGQFTIADITGIVALEFMRPAKLSVDPALEHVARWQTDIFARPSVQIPKPAEKAS